jgi:hypothetical protein
MAESVSGGIAEGLGQTIVPAMQRAQESKFALQLQSSKIQQEMQSRLQEAQQMLPIEAQKLAIQKQISGVPEEQYRPMFASLGIPVQVGMGDLQPEVATMYMRAGAEENARKAAMAVALAGKEGQAQPVYDPNFGIKIGERTVNPLGGQSTIHADPDASKKLEEARLLSTMQLQLGKVDEAAQGVDFGRISGLGAKIGGAIGMRPDVTRFNNLKSTVALMGPHFIAGYNRFNDPEYNRLNSQVSTMSTGTEYKQWRQDVGDMLARKMQDIGFGQDPNYILNKLNQQAQPQGQPQSGVPTAQSPAQTQPIPSTGGLTQNDFAAEDARRASLAGPSKKGK